MMTDGTGETYPDAGVIATRPATAPAAAPSTLGSPLIVQDIANRESAPAAAAASVATNAVAASPSAASALPALKPNQPNHSRPAPSTVIVMSCGSSGSVPKPC